MYIQNDSVVSCIEYSGILRYSLWDSTLVQVENGVSTKIELPSPILAIHSIGNQVYIGCIEGGVYKVQDKSITKILQGNASIECGGQQVKAVIGIHSYKDTLICVFINGEIILYDLISQSITKRYSAAGLIVSSSTNRSKIVCVVETSKIEVHDISTEEKRTITPNIEGAQINKAILTEDTSSAAIICATDIGKVKVEYLNGTKDTVEYLFKAHKKDQENEEIFYPVTMIQEISPFEILTGGADGKIHLWNIKAKTKIKTIYNNPDRSILQGQIVQSNHTITSLALALGDSTDSIYLTDTQTSSYIHIISSEELSLPSVPESSDKTIKALG
ncbi:hypothetical protein NEOKW01_0112 [Nematocida sp. AWRm80]|nr:hypothetical protein NEOKW01_0112 [Nematocida sp. AWRm80]